MRSTAAPHPPPHIHLKHGVGVDQWDRGGNIYCSSLLEAPQLHSQEGRCAAFHTFGPSGGCGTRLRSSCSASAAFWWKRRPGPRSGPRSGPRPCQLPSFSPGR